jgi:O-antigen biosynthesis protein
LKNKIETRDENLPETAARELNATRERTEVSELTDKLLRTEEALNKVQAMLSEREAELAKIYGSRGWKLLGFLWSVRLVTAPPESRRTAFMKKTLTIIRNPFSRCRTFVKRHTQTSSARPCISWPAYSFLRFKSALRATNKGRLHTVQVPGAQDKVSVILPVYDGVSHVAETIVDILSQSYEHFELIIVEDKSSDRTHGIGANYAAHDHRIKLFHHREQKLSCVLNIGLHHAEGEFLTWISPHVHIRPNFLRELVDYLQRHPDLDMVYANLDITRGNGQPLGSTPHFRFCECRADSGDVSSPTHVAEPDMNAGNFVGPAFLYRNRMDFLLGDYSVNRSGAEDYDYWMRLNALGTIQGADFSEPLCECRRPLHSLIDRGEQPAIAPGRDSLMVFEDARRDFYLSPAVWLFDKATDQPAQMVTTNMRAWIRAARHIPLESSSLAQKFGYRWWLPLVAVRLTSDVKDAYAIPNWPEQAFKVIIMVGPTALPSNVPCQWDLCISNQEFQNPPPRLSGPRRGWLAATNIDTICSVIDIRVKQAHLAGLEDQIARHDPPQFKFSVVICTYHRGTLLKESILSTARQTLSQQSYEVIVVNNDPADGMVHEILEEVRKSELAHRPEQLIEVSCPFKGLSFARNAGISVARGEIVVFLDDDAVVLPDWLEQIDRATLAFPDAGVIGGSILLNIPKPRPRWLRVGWEHYWSQFEPAYQNPRTVEDWGSYPWGANWSARRKALLEIGGFRTKYGRRGDDFAGGEEVVAASLIRRLGYKIAVAPAARVVHNPDQRRYSLKHISRTIRSLVQTTYQTQIDLYAPIIPSIGDVQNIREKHLSEVFSRDPLSWHSRLEHWLFARAYKKLIRRMRRDLHHREELAETRVQSGDGIIG